MRLILIFISFYLIGCASTPSLVSTDFKPGQGNYPVLLEDDDLQLQLLNSQSRKGVQTFDLTILNKGEQPLTIYPDDMYYSVLDQETADPVYPMSWEEVEAYQIEKSKQNRNIGLAVVGAVVAIATVAVLTSDGNKTSTNSSSTRNRSDQITESRKVISNNSSSGTKSRKPIPDYSIGKSSPPTKIRRTSSSRSVRRSERYYYPSNRYQLNFIDVFIDPYPRFPQQREVIPADQTKDNTNNLFLPTTIQPGEYAKGKVYFKFNPGESYRFVIPIEQMDYIIHLKKK